MARSTHNPDYQLLLTVLKAARKRLGVSQIELAARLGNTQTFVSKCVGAACLTRTDDLPLTRRLLYQLS